MAELAGPGRLIEAIKAIKAGTPEQVIALIDGGADVNERDADQSTPLHLASTKIFNPRSAEEVVRKLLERGANLNAQDSTGKTPFMTAMLAINFPLAKLILEKDLDLELKDRGERTSLMYGVSGEDVSIVRKLVEKGADLNARDWKGETPLMQAIESGRVRRVAIVNRILEKNQNFDLQDNNGNTALMHAAARDNENIVRQLLEKGADKTLTNKRGQTAYDRASVPEIKDLLRIDTTARFEGTKKAEIDYFDIFLGKADTEEQALANVKKHTFCPVCLGKTETTEGCLYVKHVCPEDKRHSDLYAKYKDPDTGEISWCSECGRICKKDQHYGFALVIRDIPPLKPSGATCEAAGGGGIPEKLKRVVRYVDYLFELEHFVGEISENDARIELIEEVWNAPARRLRYDPLKFGFKTDTSVFKAGGGIQIKGMYESDNVQCLAKKSGKRTRKNLRKKKKVKT